MLCNQNLIALKEFCRKWVNRSYEDNGIRMILKLNILYKRLHNASRTRELMILCYIWKSKKLHILSLKTDVSGNLFSFSQFKTYLWAIFEITHHKSVSNIIALQNWMYFCTKILTCQLYSTFVLIAIILSDWIVINL